MTGRYPYQPAPTGQASKISRKAIVGGGVGALFLMMASCGIGAALGGGGDSTQAAPTVTSTTTLTETTTAASNETVWRTTTVTPSPTETTTEVADQTDDSANTPRGLVGPRTTTPTANSDSGAGSASYGSCSAARAAGAAPLYEGQPGYSSSLDRDGDGVACE
ncbi:excalibur calcium-binding domain-containing protein [Gordonia jacobaea]|uniref:excalibur calcium-binding domain-containing protein n=1 Tax=Gordonia jacobaea TaxID=122202 RepID=UPI003D764D54